MTTTKKWAKVKPGGLYGWKKTQAESTRHTILNKAVKKDSYDTIIKRLNQMINITEDKETKKAMKKDMAYLQKKHKKDGK